MRARVVTKKEVEDDGTGKLRSVAKAAMGGVEGAAEILEGGVERGLAGDAAGGGGFGILFELRDDISASLKDLIALFAPGRREALEECWKAGPAVTIVGRKVGATEERLQIRSEKDRHGPSAASGGRLDVCHIDAGDIGTFFAIYLYGHERAVDHFGDVFAFERFALHHVTPVAGGIADREEDRLVLAPGLLEGFVAPRIPVDGIMCVLL